MSEHKTPQQRFDYIVSRLKRHAEDVDMGAEELSSILISTAAQLLGQTEVKLQDVVATFIADYLSAKGRREHPLFSVPAVGPPVLVPEEPGERP